MSVISDNIRRLREREGIEQLELAERLGISNKTISSWECGRTEPRIGMIERIADALGCTKADIIEPETVTYMFKEAQLMTKGQRIRKARESKNMTQTELANRLKISKQTLYKYENDIITNIPSNIIEQIAEITDCTPAYIMGWEDVAYAFNAPSDYTRRLSAYVEKMRLLSSEAREIIFDQVDYQLHKEGKDEG